MYDITVTAGERIELAAIGVGYEEMLTPESKTRQMDEARVNVVDVVQNLTAIAQENAASTEETSASVAEVNSIVSNISENAEMMKGIADELERNMEIFKL